MLQMARVGASNVTVGTGDYDISGIANCDESRNCRGTAACDNSLGLPLNSRPPRSLMCRFRMPGWRDYPCAPGAGVGKAPRHEIAVGEARTVQRALWEFGGVVRYVVA